MDIDNSEATIILFRIDVLVEPNAILIELTLETLQYLFNCSICSDAKN